MPLSTTIIKNKLALVPWTQKDNEAQNIINGASPQELKNLDAEGVLRLYEALALMPPRVYSSRDKAAMKKLVTHTEFQPVTNTPEYGVNLVKNVQKGNPVIQSQLTSDIITRIYAAEKKRLGWYESIIDGSTVGRGQLGQPAYEDVKQPMRFKSVLETCLTRDLLAKLLSNHDRLPHHATGFDMKTTASRFPNSTVMSGGIRYRRISLFRPTSQFELSPQPSLAVQQRTRRVSRWPFIMECVINMKIRKMKNSDILLTVRKRFVLRHKPFPTCLGRIRCVPWSEP